MNKDDLIEKAAKRKGMTQKDIKQAYEGIFELISDTLANGEDVHLVNFGTFEAREVKERYGRNPKLHSELIKQGVPEEEAKERAKVFIEAKKKPAFKPAKGLKDKVKAK